MWERIDGRFRLSICRVISMRWVAEATPCMFDGSTTREWSDRWFDCGNAIAASGGTEEDEWEGVCGKSTAVAGAVESDNR